MAQYAMRDKVVRMQLRLGRQTRSRIRVSMLQADNRAGFQKRCCQEVAIFKTLLPVQQNQSGADAIVFTWSRVAMQIGCARAAAVIVVIRHLRSRLESSTYLFVCINVNGR